MDSYFIRHWPRSKPISGTTTKENEQIQEWLFKNRMIGIHYANTCETEPKAYKKCYRSKILNFVNLAKDGGFICAEYPAISKMLIGKIQRGEVECQKDMYCIKTIKLSGSRSVCDGLRLRLRASAPRQGTMSHWRSIEDRLEVLLSRKIKKEWSWLTSDEQEVICQEYLRSSEMSSDLRLSNLLMPVGRTLKDVDIYGITEKGNELYAQVTHSKDWPTIDKKIKALEYYKGTLIFFCPKKLCKKNGKITFIGIEDVQNWLLTKKHLSEKIWTLP